MSIRRRYVRVRNFGVFQGASYGVKLKLSINTMRGRCTEATVRIPCLTFFNLLDTSGAMTTITTTSPVKRVPQSVLFLLYGSIDRSFIQLTLFLTFDEYVECSHSNSKVEIKCKKSKISCVLLIIRDQVFQFTITQEYIPHTSTSSK